MWSLITRWGTNLHFKIVKYMFKRLKKTKMKMWIEVIHELKWWTIKSWNNIITKVLTNCRQNQNYAYTKEFKGIKYPAFGKDKY